MENIPRDNSGLLCLQFLFSQVRRNVNFSSLMTQKVVEQYAVEPENVLMTLAGDQRLAPEIITSPETLLKLKQRSLIKKI